MYGGDNNINGSNNKLANGGVINGVAAWPAWRLA
jgi:hypothetical protein